MSLQNKYRDVQLIPLGEGTLLAVACDSCGAIGEKEQDQVKVPSFIVGKYTARVALMEVLSLGAKVVSVTANICNEYYPTGEDMIHGIKSELQDCNIEVPITISTEKNMITSMTALGVTVMGTVDEKELLMNRSKAGDFVYVLGMPKVGVEVVEDQGEITNTASLVMLLHQENIKEIIPVGSKGIERELDGFLKHSGLKMSYIKDLPLDIKKTAGPSTAVIVIGGQEFKNSLGLPQNLIGKLY